MSLTLCRVFDVILAIISHHSSPKDIPSASTTANFSNKTVSISSRVSSSGQFPSPVIQLHRLLLVLLWLLLQHLVADMSRLPSFLSSTSKSTDSSIAADSDLSRILSVLAFHMDIFVHWLEVRIILIRLCYVIL